MKKILVTTSWDDGDKLDLKLAELLNKYDLKGTFYIDNKTPGRLSVQEIKKINQTQEIGAHTIDHPRLAEVDKETARTQIIGSKKYLTEILGTPPKMFCYPFGSFNQEIKNLVKEAGFLGARTTKTFSFDPPKDFFELGTSLHVYPFPLRRKDAKQIHFSRYLFKPLTKNFKEMRRLKLPLNSYFSWFNLAKNMFDLSRETGEVFHLWGHSWEIERYGMWDQLEKLFEYISGQDGVVAVTNSQLLEKV